MNLRIANKVLKERYARLTGAKSSGASHSTQQYNRAQARIDKHRNVGVLTPEETVAECIHPV